MTNYLKPRARCQACGFRFNCSHDTCKQHRFCVCVEDKSYVDDAIDRQEDAEFRDPLMYAGDLDFDSLTGRSF